MIIKKGEENDVCILFVISLLLYKLIMIIIQRKKIIGEKNWKLVIISAILFFIKNAWTLCTRTWNCEQLKISVDKKNGCLAIEHEEFFICIIAIGMREGETTYSTLDIIYSIIIYFKKHHVINIFFFHMLLHIGHNSHDAYIDYRIYISCWRNKNSYKLKYEIL